ncbi:uncharacterized [Tachysurus ichikawai]
MTEQHLNFLASSTNRVSQASGPSGPRSQEGKRASGNLSAGQQSQLNSMSATLQYDQVTQLNSDTSSPSNASGESGNLGIS